MVMRITEVEIVSDKDCLDHVSEPFISTSMSVPIGYNGPSTVLRSLGTHEIAVGFAILSGSGT